MYNDENVFTDLYISLESSIMGVVGANKLMGIGLSGLQVSLKVTIIL